MVVVALNSAQRNHMIQRCSEVTHAPPCLGPEVHARQAVADCTGRLIFRCDFRIADKRAVRVKSRSGNGCLGIRLLSGQDASRTNDGEDRHPA